MDEVDRVLGEVVGALLTAVHDVLVGLGTRGSLKGRLAAQALKGQDANGPHIHCVRVGQQCLVLVLLRPALLRAHQHLPTQLALTMPVGLHHRLLAWTLERQQHHQAKGLQCQGLKGCCPVGLRWQSAASASHADPGHTASIWLPGAGPAGQLASPMAQTPAGPSRLPKQI